MGSKYPNSIDTDVELPRVDELTEIGLETLNTLRDCVFNIEETLGTNPHGSVADLATRLNISINLDGTLKASALSTVGLVTLPITNSQIGTGAGIEESKLDLDYSTVYLKTQIDALDVFLTSVNNKVIVDIAHMLQHIAHPSIYGRHETQDVDGYVSGIYDGYNLQGIINDLDQRIQNHISISAVGAHRASNISFDPAGLVIESTDVQSAIEELDRIQEVIINKHRDNMHSNGILQTQELFKDGTNLLTIVSASALNSITTGSVSVQFTSAPSGLAQALRSDTIRITLNSRAYDFVIDTINTSTNVVSFYGTMPSSGSGGIATIYRNIHKVTALSNLILAQRQDSVIQMVHPGAPYLLSSTSIDTRKITASLKNIKITWTTGNTGDLDVKTALDAITTSSSAWTLTNLVKALNSLFRSETPNRHYPLIAFEYANRLGIAYDEAKDGVWLQVTAPSSGSAWSLLGFTTGETVYGESPKRFYIDGYEFSSVYKKIETTAQASGNSLDTFPAGIDILGSGIKPGDLLRVYDSSTAVDNGSFICDAVSGSAILVNEHPGFTVDTVGFRIFGDTFAMITPPSIPTFYEIFVDGYDDSAARLYGAKRAEISNVSGSANSLFNTYFNIIDVSRTFEAATRRIYYDNTAKTLVMGIASSGITIYNSSRGATVQLPLSNVEGFRFKLYDNNGVDYIEMEVSSATIYVATGNNAITLTVYDAIDEDKFLQVGAVHHNATKFIGLSDRRQFGNIGRYDLRTDAVRDYITYPNSLLRGNGVFYGFVTQARGGNTEIDAYGGVAHVNGSIKFVDSRIIAIPQEGAAIYNLFIDDNGTFQFLKDGAIVSGVLATPSLSEILTATDKTIIAQVELNGGNAITAIRDYRRYVGDIDSKIELIAEENSITNGSFASLASVMNWINACDGAGLPTSRTVRIRGEITHNLAPVAPLIGTVTVPNNVKIIGDIRNSTSSTPTPSIKLTGVGVTFLSIGDNFTIEDVVINMDSSSSVQNVLKSTSSTTYGTVVKNCTFNTLRPSGSGCVVLNLSASTVDNIIFRDNKISFNSSSNSNTVILFNTGAGITNTFIDGNIATFASTSANTFIDGNDGIISFSYVANNLLTYVTSAANKIYACGTGGNTNIVIDNCIFNLATSTDVNAYAVAIGNAVNITIKDCLFNYSSLVATNNAVYLIYSGSTATNCKLLNNHFKNIARGISLASDASDLMIKNNKFENFSIYAFVANFDVINSNINDNIFLTGNNSPSAIAFVQKTLKVNILSNIIISENTSGQSNYAILFANSADYVEYCNVSNNIIYNTTSNAGFAWGIRVFSAALNKYINVSNNIIKMEYNGRAIQLGTAKYSNICNNILSNVEVGIYFETTAEYCNIQSNNLISNASNPTTTAIYFDACSYCLIDGNTINGFQSSGVSDSAIKINSTLISCSIINNIFYNLNTTRALAFFGNITHCTINNNIININMSSSSNYAIDFASGVNNNIIINGNILNATGSTSDGSMVYFAPDSSHPLTNIIISNNIIYSSATSGTLTGIKFIAGGGGAPGGDSKNINITKNLIKLRGIGIYISAINDFFINDNNILPTNSIEPIYVDANSTSSALYSIISNNYLQTLSGSATVEAIDVRGTIYNLFIFSNLLIRNTTSAHSAYTIYFHPSGGNYAFITNNMFVDNHTAASSYAMIYMTGSSFDKIQISNNVMYSIDSSGTYDYVIKNNNPSGIANVHCVLNNLRYTVASSLNKIDMGASTNGIDYLNFGQYYNLIIPPSCMSADDTATYWKLYSIVYGIQKIAAYRTAVDNAYNELFIDFNNNSIAIGSVIVYIRILYEIAAGGNTSDLSAALYSQDYTSGLATASSISLGSTPSFSVGSSATTDVTPASTLYIRRGYNYFVKVVSNGPASGANRYIYGAFVTYIL